MITLNFRSKQSYDLIFMMKKFNIKKLLVGFLIVVLVVVAGAGIGVYVVWHNEISTFMSIELLRDRNDEHNDGAVYAMYVKGGFYLDEFVAQSRMAAMRQV